MIVPNTVSIPTALGPTQSWQYCRHSNVFSIKNRLSTAHKSVLFGSSYPSGAPKVTFHNISGLNPHTLISHLIERFQAKTPQNSFELCLKYLTSFRVFESHFPTPLFIHSVACDAVMYFSSMHLEHSFTNDMMRFVIYIMK